MKTAIARWRTPLLPLCLALASIAGCTSYSTDSNEVGVRTRKIFGAGIEQSYYPQGATYFFAPFLSDWATFDIKLQNLEMTAVANRGDRQGDDAIEFKTTDGNDISVNVTIAWRLDPKKTPQLLARVGRSTADIKEKLVRPACRTYIRDAFNELHSEEFYNTVQRNEKGNRAKARLNLELGPEGIVVEQVIVGQYFLNKEYQKVIHDRKIAEQNAERLKSEAQAAEAEMSRNLEKAKGDVQVQIAQAKGEAEQIQIATDRDYYQKEREAKAILAEATARAKGIEKQNRAMAGAGGRTMVKLRIAEALAGKPIVIVPAGSGASLQKIDINRIFESVLANEATQSSPPPAAATRSPSE
jgi:regulator of protease activity HflC (stomatin/prohibitin superfamily)